MRKILLLCAVAFFATNGLNTASGQGITVVPNPTTPDLFAWTGTGAYYGYSAGPEILNNSLVLEYNPTATSDLSLIKQQLAVYTGGNALTLIPNPDDGQGVFFNSIRIVFDNKLFFIYINTAGIQQLASFNGSSITLYPNPDASPTGFIGSPRILNNQLYVAYVNIAGVTQFGRFNGSGITLIPNPDNSATGFFNNYSAVFNNTLVSRYVTAEGPRKLAIFDGNTWTILPNPDNTTRGVYPVFPAAYHNKLYFTYYSATNQYQLLEYDGVNNSTLIANPQNSAVNNAGVTGNFPIVCNDTLFIQYKNTSNVYQLAKFGGSNIELVPNPDDSPYGYWFTPDVYMNNLFLLYLKADNSRHLAQYIPGGDSIHIIPNPDAGTGYWELPIVYDNKLYLKYSDAQDKFRLAYYDGNDSLGLIANPDGIYNAAPGNNGYTGFPIIWNNLLFMQFGSVPFGYSGNLAYFNGSVLPLSLLNFTGRLQDGKALLEWQTSNELNTSHFAVERSSSASNFKAIATVTAKGDGKTVTSYSFNDAHPPQGTNYYRLKMVDKDGKFTYSKIVQVNINGSSIAVSIYPNPVTSVLKINIPGVTGTIDVIITDATGKNVMQQVLAGNTATLNTSRLPAGVYHLVVTVNGKTETRQFVKQ